MAHDEHEEPAEVEFFGFRLKVNNPHLAALLNSDVTDDVQVVGGRARRAFGRTAADAAQEPGGEPPAQPQPDDDG